jgi:hypothetical protein
MNAQILANPLVTLLVALLLRLRLWLWQHPHHVGR